jgi:hypothetical protein
MAPTTVIGTVRPRVGGWLQEASIAGGFFLSARSFFHHSLNRPGANVTGIANLAAELAAKQLQLLRELIPNAALFGVLTDPAFPATQSIIADLKAAR